MLVQTIFVDCLCCEAAYLEVLKEKSKEKDNAAAESLSTFYRAAMQGYLKWDWLI